MTFQFLPSIFSAFKFSGLGNDAIGEVEAVCGRPVVGKDFLKLLHSAGRCGHVFDL